MVRKAMKFTPEVLLSASRRSAGIPNALGDRYAYTTSSYDFKTHKKTTELVILDVRTNAGVFLAQNESISDISWLDDAGDEFVCLRAEDDGSTSVVIGVGAPDYLPPNDVWEQRHYVAGSIDGAVADLKVARLGDGGFGFVVSGRVAKDGSLFNERKAKKTQSTGRLYEGLYVRHWDQYEEKERPALWYGKLTKSFSGKLAKDKKDRYGISSLTNALRNSGLESPILPFGGTDNFDVSHNRIIFVAKDPSINPALNTKSNVYIINVTSWEGRKHPDVLQQVFIPGFEGASANPVISPDGHKAAFLSMKANGYEADKNQIFVLPDLDLTTLTAQRAFASSDSNYDGGWNRSPSSIAFSPDGESLLAIAEEYGTSRVFLLQTDLSDVSEPTRLTTRGSITDIRPLPGGRIFISGSSIIDNSFYAMLDARIPPGRTIADTKDLVIWQHSNSQNGNKFGLHPGQVDSIWTPASNKAINKEVHSIVVRPSDFSADKKYPVAYLIHGGPQGSWADNWSTRWNPAVFAEQGYIVIAPNPTGSTGYGQAFCDAIQDNWGGDPLQDIENCFEWVGENMPEADNERAVALGASYGGYMINWIQGHPFGRKFQALVCHDGVLTTTGMLATEELYFPLHDLGGVPWLNSNTSTSSHPTVPFPHATAGLDAWKKWDPSQHLSNFSTPQLTIHSSRDFRIPISDGLAAFNVLQARGIPSQFLTFPDENHWVLKPENGLVWHKVVLNWIHRFVGKEAFCAEDVDGEAFWGGVRGEREEVVGMEGVGKVET